MSADTDDAYSGQDLNVDFHSEYKVATFFVDASSYVIARAMFSE